MNKNRKGHSKKKESYDFDALSKSLPSLTEHIISKEDGGKTIDFSNANSVYQLNKALLINRYRLIDWDIPSKYLIPGVPGRAEYIHTCASFSGKLNGGQVPKGKSNVILDIGTGANMVFPIVGISDYGWSFVGSDIEQEALDVAKAIAAINPSIKNNITFRLQETHTRVFDQIVHHGDSFLLSICNPPFHASAAEAKKASARKRKNLKYKKESLNFSGSPYELWTKGGEFAFISNMIRESFKYRSQVKWFTALVSKEDHIEGLVKKIERLNPSKVEVLKMERGNKKSRILVWGWQNN